MKDILVRIHRGAFITPKLMKTMFRIGNASMTLPYIHQQNREQAICAYFLLTKGRNQMHLVASSHYKICFHEAQIWIRLHVNRMICMLCQINTVKYDHSFCHQLHLNNSCFAHFWCQKDAHFDMVDRLDKFRTTDSLVHKIVFFSQYFRGRE